MKEAMFYESLPDGSVKCHLCPHECIIKPNMRGVCGVRENINGKLYSLVYGKIVSTNIDPIEKKPLFHFKPGSKALSIATVGCNLKCEFCQNFDISQAPKPKRPIIGHELTPEDVVEMAKRYNCSSIAYTYTEPTIFYEFALDTAKLAHKNGIKNLWISNGFTNSEPIKEISKYIDAANIDLKGSDKFYREITGGRLEPVMNTVETLHKMGVWVEVTTLVIPTYNDSKEDLTNIASFISGVDKSIPWHISRFFPMYKMLDVPPTPISKLREAYDIGKNAGLKYVYIGNVPGKVDTICPKCGHHVIERTGYDVSNHLKHGKCPKCGYKIEGVFE